MVLPSILLSARAELIAAAAFALLSSSAWSDPIVVDFTGTVTSSSNVGSVKAGMTITGSYLIDLANANPYSSEGTVNNQLPWVYAVSNGPDGNPLGNSYVEPGPVFASTASVGGFKYASAESPLIDNFSQVSGAGQGYYATEQASPTAHLTTSSTIQLTATGNGVPYTSAGAPQFGAGVTGMGSIDVDKSGREQEVDYTILSVHRVNSPEIDGASAASALTLLAGCAAVARGRRRRSVPFG
jgi:hypothetical protein